MFQMRRCFTVFVMLFGVLATAATTAAQTNPLRTIGYQGYFPIRHVATTRAVNPFVNSPQPFVNFPRPVVYPHVAQHTVQASSLPGGLHMRMPARIGAQQLPYSAGLSRASINLPTPTSSPRNVVPTVTIRLGTDVWFRGTFGPQVQTR